MSDPYLWDGSGPPDPDVQRLERALSSARYDRPAPEIPGGGGRRPMRRRFLAAAAAMIAVAAAVGGWFALRPRPSNAPSAWQVARVEGSPRVGSQSLNETDRLDVGEWIETDGSSRARITASELGRVEIDPHTRIRLLETRPTEHRLELARGTIHAMIHAPPRLFFVETPSAVAADLGCAYTLEVDDSGAGLLEVSLGWVSFERDGRESMVPSGGACATRLGLGPGTPYFKDSSDALRAALTRFDFESCGPPDIATVLTEARPRDTLTLWHLLSRVDGAEREKVFDRIVALVPPPESVTRVGALRLDKEMLGIWKDSLRNSWW